MKIKEKIYMNSEELYKNGPITIVAFGDSITHGAVGFDEINYETVYWNRLKNKIHNVRNYVPVNVINAGIGGATAARSLDRLDRQVIVHNPDLIIVCFGLNDVNGTLEAYLDSLKTIFEKCKACGSDIIFMTPNMLNTYVAEEIPEEYLKYAAVTAEYQNNGRMDTYMNAAVSLARQMQITVCDCYAKWKKISETEDTTKMLANDINHPTEEMHELFAQSLFDIIFDDAERKTDVSSNTMYKE